MTSSTPEGQSPPCLACGKTPSENVSIHSCLARRHRTIHEQITDIVGSLRTKEACETSEIVCLPCLKLLLGINNLELELAGLKREFCAVFQLGVETRKGRPEDCKESLSAENGDFQLGVESRKGQVDECVDRLGAQDGVFQLGVESRKSQVENCVEGLSAEDGDFQLGIESRKGQVENYEKSLSAENGVFQHGVRTPQYRLGTEIGERSNCDNDENVDNDYDDSGDSDINGNVNGLLLNSDNDGKDRTNSESTKGDNDDDDGDDSEVNHDENDTIFKIGNDNEGDEYRTTEDETKNHVIQNKGKHFNSYRSSNGKNASINEENGEENEPSYINERGPSRRTKRTSDQVDVSTEKKLQTNKRPPSKEDETGKFDEASFRVGQSDAPTVKSAISEAGMGSNPDIVVSGTDPTTNGLQGIRRSRRRTAVSEVMQPIKRRKSSRRNKETTKTKRDEEVVSTLEDVHSGDREIVGDIKEDNNKGSVCACKICGHKYGSPEGLAEHRARAHADVYKYVCDVCPRGVRFCNKWELTRHCKLQHQVHIHKCPGCGAEEASQQSLDQHIINHHPDSRFFKCQICCKAFRTYRYLHFVHIKRCHIGLPIKYHCDKCHKGFKDKSSLDNHRHTHSEVKNYSCEFCGALFRSPYSLKVHVNTHTQEKKYACQVCGMSFLRLCNLIGHRKYVHSRDGRYVCEVCGKLVHTHRGLVRHQTLYHAKGKLFPCEECGRSFAKKESLRAHFLTQHAQDRPHKCDCGKAYANGSRLRRHLKSAHGLDGADNGLGFRAEEGQADDGLKMADVENEEDNVVIITVKECAPHLYSVQSTSPHSQEVMAPSDAPSTHVVNDPIVSTEHLVNTHRVELPLLHSTFSTIAADRMGLSTPILLAALNSNPVAAVHQSKETHNIPLHIHHETSQSTYEQTATNTNKQSNNPQTANPFQSSTSVVSPGEARNSLQILQGEEEEEGAHSNNNDSPLHSELLALPPMHPSTSNGVPVTYITSWPT